MTPRAKFYVNLQKGASRQIDEIHILGYRPTHIFIAVCLFPETHRSDPGRIFAPDGRNDGVSRKYVLFGVKKFEINI